MDLEKLIRDYQTPDEARELVEKTRIALLVGISGAGKDSTKQELLKSPDFQDIVSHTTRLPRENNGRMEKDGVDYYFVSPDFARNMIRWQKFVEVKYVHDTVYGTSINELQKAHDLGKIAVTDMDVQGVAEYKALSDNVVALFILPPDYDTWRERLSRRYSSQSEFEAEWPRRRTSALNELKEALSVPYYHFIVNHDRGRTALVASEIAHKGNEFNHKDEEARHSARLLLESIVERAE